MTESDMHFTGLILAAGKGTRFQTSEPMPKVLRSILGKPMISYAIDTLSNAGIEDIALIVGFHSDEVIHALGNSFEYIIQTEQKGSGHAVACAKDHFQGRAGSMIIMCGDSPLFRAETVRALMHEHSRTNAVATLASAILDDPYGYGRIMRDSAGRISGIVEEKCASDTQRSIKEVNGGAYAFDIEWLFANIDKMLINDAGEYNLTDMIRVAIEQNRTVSAVQCDGGELLGVNNPEQLKAVEDILRGRKG